MDRLFRDTYNFDSSGFEDIHLLVIIHTEQQAEINFLPSLKPCITGKTLTKSTTFSSENAGVTTIMLLKQMTCFSADLR
jgi:hypothetical protein